MIYGGTDLKSFISTTQISYLTFNKYEIERMLEKFKEIHRYIEIRSR
jgi:hypothetical protein